jgi:hypothetical protein
MIEESEAREGGNGGKEHGDGKWMRWKSRMDWESEGALKNKQMPQ